MWILRIRIRIPNSDYLYALTFHSLGFSYVLLHLTHLIGMKYTYDIPSRDDADLLGDRTSKLSQLAKFAPRKILHRNSSISFLGFSNYLYIPPPPSSFFPVQKVYFCFLLNFQQCCGSGSLASVSFRASWIRIRHYLNSSGSFHHEAKKKFY